MPNRIAAFLKNLKAFNFNLAFDATTMMVHRRKAFSLRTAANMIVYTADDIMPLATRRKSLLNFKLVFNIIIFHPVQFVFIEHVHVS